MLSGGSKKLGNVVSGHKGISINNKVVPVLLNRLVADSGKSTRP